MRWLVFAIAWCFWTAILVGPADMAPPLAVALAFLCAAVCSIADLIVVAIIAMISGDY